MERKITKVGNSYGITFPKDLLKEAGISYGDNVKVELKDGNIVLRKKEDIKLPEDISADFFEVLERNIEKHEKTVRDLVDR
ncbi:AbrB/MazE/SpoVT family DNA-binding domain-containing protein [Lentibacillus lipolyticus]|nr:AbrB/MazE/SpoVT family DNA-binding domain-containing protein [Lentibacillus lipolyticus]